MDNGFNDLQDNTSKTAVLLVHGIGIQNRFDFLADFTDGLVKTSASPKSTYVFSHNHDQPLGKGVTLDLAVNKEEGAKTPVDFYECYWSPMMNGATNAFSVILFLIQTLYRMLPCAQLKSPSPMRQASRTRVAGYPGFGTFVWKWCQSATYFLFAVAAIVSSMYLAIGAGSLAIDRSVILRQYALSTKQPKNAPAQTTTSVRQAVSVTAGKNTIASNFFMMITISADDNLQKILSSPNIDDPRKTYFSLTFTNREKGKYEWDRWMEATMKNYTIGEWRPAVQRVIEATLEFFKTSIIYPFTRGTNIDGSPTTKSWPQIGYVVAQSTPRSLSFTVILSFLACILLFTSVRVIFASLYRLINNQGIISFNVAVTALAVIVGGIYGALLAASDPSILYVALSMIPIRLLYGFTKVFLTNTLGDIEVYAQRNANSKKYAIREVVLERATKDIRRLLDSKYENIVIVGHSLGSVVALEALRRLYHDIRLGSGQGITMNEFFKIKHFVTVGSPIRKFAMFFKADSAIGKYDELSTASDSIIFSSTAGEPSRILWTNYWNILDIVSDPLKGFTNVIDQKTGNPIVSSFWTHSAYWNSNDFTEHFATHLRNR